MRTEDVLGQRWETRCLQMFALVGIFLKLPKQARGATGNTVGKLLVSFKSKTDTPWLSNATPRNIPNKNAYVCSQEDMK